MQDKKNAHPFKIEELEERLEIGTWGWVDPMNDECVGCDGAEDEVGIDP